MDLSGRWRAQLGSSELAKQFADPAFDDGGWIDVDVPHHWRDVAAFAHADGPVLYRRRFSFDEPAAGRRRFLVLDGVFYYGDVWLDGEYLGATEGYFAPHRFEVGDQLARPGEHVLAVEVACPPQRDRTAKRTVTGVFGHWNGADPTWNPGGIWRPVRIRETGPAAIARSRVLCTEATAEQGRIEVALSLDAAATSDAVLHAVVRGPDGEVLLDATRAASLAAGPNELTWTLTVPAPPRWWPRTMGAQPLCVLALEVEIQGASSDRAEIRTAFREVRFDDWVLSVNGERLFLKGSNLAPTRMGLAHTDAAGVRRDLDLAAGAHLDFVRVFGHVAHPALYDAADETGMLVWQELPLQWDYAHGVRKQAIRQAQAMVDLLGAHPSVFLWCAHSAPVAFDLEPGETPAPTARLKLAATAALPTWTKDVLDRSIALAIARRDHTRPVIRHSGALPGVTEGGSDSHLSYGWRYGTVRDLAPALRRWPRRGRFVSQFGAQAVPSTAAWMRPETWPDLDWDSLGRHHAFDAEAFARLVPSHDAKTFDEWRDASQAYQAALIQLQVEDLRRVRYAPCGGFAQYHLADPEPAVSESVLDHERVPKRGYGALRDACRPVLAMIDPRTGDVHVVNDARVSLRDVGVTAVVDGRVHRWAGDVAADGIAFVGRVDLADAVDVEVVLDHPQTGIVTNRYPLLVLRPD